jgi:hypothetical protein
MSKLLMVKFEVYETIGCSFPHVDTSVPYVKLDFEPSQPSELQELKDEGQRDNVCEMPQADPN